MDSANLNEKKVSVGRGQTIKLPRIDQIEKKLSEKKQRIPQPPKTVSCRQNPQQIAFLPRKSMEREEGRNAPHTM